MSAGSAVPPSQGNALWIGTACYVFSAFCWGLNLPLTAVLFRTFDPFFMSPLRVAIAVLVLGSLLALTQGWRALAVPLGARRLALMTLAMASFFMMYNLGLRYTNTITAATLMAGGPVYSAITLRVVTGQRLEKGFWGAAVLTLLGAGLAVYGRASDTGQGLVLGGGEPLIVVSTVGWTLYSIYAQRWFDPKVPQLRRTFSASLGALIWLVLFWQLVMAAGIVAPPSIVPDGQAITYLLITAVLSTALAGVTWNIGVNRIGLAAGTLWQNTVPVFGVLASMFFGILPTMMQVLGGAIVLSGVLYMQWHRMRSVP